MRHAAATVLLLAFAAYDVHAADVVLDPPILVKHVDGELHVGASGAVEAYRITSGADGELAPKVAEMVEHLRFEPEEVDGHPVPKTLPMRVTLTAQPTGGDGLEVQLDNIEFATTSGVGTCPLLTERRGRPGVRVISRTPVVYPLMARANGVNAKVLAVVRLHPDGTVADAAIRQSGLIDAQGEPRVVAQLLVELEAAVLDAVKQWRWKIDGPTPSAESKELMGLVPVHFTMMGSKPTPRGDWSWLTRNAKRFAAWEPRDDGWPSLGVADIDENDGACDSHGLRLQMQKTAAGP